MAIDKSEQIRQRAYEIWENEGRPEGSADRHYEQAADELFGDDEHETLQELIDEDDREDEAHAQQRGNSAPSSPEVQITTGEASKPKRIGETEGP